MKIAGWICLIFGLLSFIGAASKGHSVFGPCFFIALGSFFLYRVNNRSLDKNETTPKINNTEANNSSSTKYHYIICGEESEQATTKESLEDIQSQLTLNQKEAALCLIAFFGGFNNNIEDQVTLRIFRQAAQFFGLSTSSMELSQIMSKHSNADELIDTVITIPLRAAKDFLILSCYDIIKTSVHPESFEVLTNIVNEMGYTSEELNKLLDKYQNERYAGQWNPITQ